MIGCVVALALMSAVGLSVVGAYFGTRHLRPEDRGPGYPDCVAPPVVSRA